MYRVKDVAISVHMRFVGTVFVNVGNGIATMV